ncbi:MAG TPA: cellulase family glycosylhydrolase [Trebonia sp.]
MWPRRRNRPRTHTRPHALAAALVGALLVGGFAAPSASAAVPSAPVSSASDASSAAVLPAAPIGHAGRWITDADGKVVLVSGVNMVNKLAPYTPAADGFDDADAAFLADNGLDAVRVGVLWEAVEPEPGVFDDSYLASIKSTVDDLASHGVVSLLDFHQDMYNETFQGEGEPAWAIDDDDVPDIPQAGFPGNYFLNPALQVTYDNFFANASVDGEGLEDWYAGMVRHVAAYFDGDSGVLGYDLFNEPSPGTALATCFTPLIGCPELDSELTGFYTTVDQAVRQVNTSALLFGEPWMSFDIGAPSSLGSTGDPEQGFSFHDYCPSDDLSTDFNITCPAFNDAVFANADAVSANTGDALLLTEFGATDDPSVLSGLVADADQARVGWLDWAFCDCGDPTTSSSQDGLVTDPADAPAGSNVDTAMLDALAVPHPELVAGTPQSYGYDTAANTFTLSYSTERADGSGTFPAGSVTDVAVPAVQYPGGYAVDVSGGTVTAAGGVLAVASCPDAASVHVTVTPGSGVTSSC